EGNIKTSEIYGRALPLHLTLSRLDSTAFGKQIEIQFKGKNQFLLTDEEGANVYSLGSQIRKPYAVFTLTASAPLQEGKIITIKFNDLIRLAGSYNNRISISPANKDASV